MGSPGWFGSSALGGTGTVPGTAKSPGPALLEVGEDGGPRTGASSLEAGVRNRAGEPRCARYEARPAKFRKFCETNSREYFIDNDVPLRGGFDLFASKCKWAAHGDNFTPGIPGSDSSAKPIVR